MARCPPQKLPRPTHKHLTKMSQYSLSTCDPLQPAKADRKDVRPTPHSTGSVSTVLFETGSIDTFPSRSGTGSSLAAESEDNVDKFNAWKSIPLTPRTSSAGSTAAVDGEHDPLLTPTKGSFAGKSMLGGPVNDTSPCSSRASTMDESAALLVDGEDGPGSSSGGTSRAFSVRRAKKRPSPLAAPSCTAAVANAETPMPTPTTPSALARAFGALVKSIL
ncbi:hypothetical protein BV20DRAFT_858488 [Pilatotrama ljubarskyi]|nr:hypothetical protein BV20DRAFT_858488 [Pilatotrama ljubarskyi]